jgi:type II restriction/modification system DNA methylase subunit YeeA
MPVNTAALKTFAPAMRRQLLEAVGRKLDLLLNSQTPDTLSTYAKQIAELREQEAENREQLLERVAYTWFNRLCALRYLDARGWHPFGCKVLMPAAVGETQPELLKLIRAGSLSAELSSHTNEARLHGLLDGQIPPAIAGADPQGEVYRELVLASCRSYHQLLPELFEGLDDASELLLPDDLLSEGSIAGGFRIAISDTDCEDVEIIGWLYQFYISEKKDQVIGKVVKSEDIPAATQLFTPNWIVKYMVQNSLGATWLATYPDSPLKGQMEFYIEPAEQTPEVQAQLAAITPESLNPEAFTLIDPACGSGHILVEAYDLLKTIYLERGYRQRDIPELILTKNLFGLDICPRAAQLAAFSLLMKGREDDRRLLERGIQLNVMALQDSTGLNVERLEASSDLSNAGVTRADLRMLVELFGHATTFGSLIKVPAVLAEKLPALSRLAQASSQALLTAAVHRQLGGLVRQAEILAQHYSAVVANPPYMGSKYMNSEVKRFAADNFSRTKSDLFSISLERLLDLCKASGFISLMTPFTWMFLKSYEELRIQITKMETLDSLIHPEYHAIWSSAAVPVCTFTIRRGHLSGYTGTFVRLTDFFGESIQPVKALEAIRNPDCGWMYRCSIDEFHKIPGSPLAYWVKSGITSAFSEHKPLAEVSVLKHGMSTSDNDRFLRQWHEVSISNLSVDSDCARTALDSGKKWFPFCKGGAFRRWFGNADYVVNWKNDGEEIKTEANQKYPYLKGNLGFVIGAEEYYFREAVTWSSISSSAASFRFLPTGFVICNKGQTLYPHKGISWEYVLAAVNSCIAPLFLEALSPTIGYELGYVKHIPIPTPSDKSPSRAQLLVNSAQYDWDSYERSWSFQLSPLLAFANEPASTVTTSYKAWIAKNKHAINEVKLLEEENNRHFIGAYRLEGEISPDVPIDQITLTVNPSYRYGGAGCSKEKLSRFCRDSMAELLSYATGCMMGRYSLEWNGLILADSRESQDEHLAAYEGKVGKPLLEVNFKPDLDGIIPMLDCEWFEDDIVARTREFLEVTFPESTVTENLRFIEESLGKDIRKYFCSEFYKDHLQTYKKRPIYWMVQSPKKGFACLIYLHRYTKDTLNQVLNNYFRPYLQKLEARLAQLGLDQLNDDLPTRERTAARKEAEKITKVLKECQAWEQDALLPLAQQRIELDLDDGVKVNYLKLQEVLAPIPGLAAKED